MSNFPIFKDGDVQIVITGSRQYQLHSNTLRASSRTMAGLLNDKYTAKLTSKAIKKGVVIRNRLDAVTNPNKGSVALIFQPVNLDSDGRPVERRPIGLDLENGKPVPYIHTAYHAVLGAFYHIPIDFGEFGEIGLTDILQMALQVTEVAEYLEVMDMITKAIESTLLSTGQVVHQSIAQDPAAWLDFAYRIRSKAIFKEALIHAAGQHNTEAMQTAMKELIPAPVSDVVQRKARFIINGVKVCLRNVLSYYPLHLQRAKTIGLADVDNFGRNSYANDIYHWMALTVFRHYITQHVADDQTHHAPDMGYALLHAISKGGDAYLDKNSLMNFHHLFPMSARGCAVVENKLNDIKEEVKKFVQPLIENKTLLHDFAAHDYLTNTNVNSYDYPWVEQPKALEVYKNNLEGSEHEADGEEESEGDEG